MALRDSLKSRFGGHAMTLQKIIQGIILLSMVSLALGTMESLDPRLRRTLAIVEIITLAIFCIEYVIRLIVAEKRWGYVFSFWGIVDLLAIVPSLVLPGSSLIALRALRFLRILRILKLARYSRALIRLRQAFASVAEELVVFLMIAGIVFFISACGIYFFEHEAQPDRFPSIPASMWWAIATLTTVGYGDVYPVTAGGKIFTFLILMIGLGLVSVPAGLIASSLTEQRDEGGENTD